MKKLLGLAFFAGITIGGAFTYYYLLTTHPAPEPAVQWRIGPKVTVSPMGTNRTFLCDSKIEPETMEISLVQCVLITSIRATL